MTHPRLLGGVWLILGTAASALGTTLDVPATYSTIQQAIAASSNGDTVLVGEGIYKENITFLDRNIVVASLFLLDGDRAHISATVIDGSSPADPDTASCVRIIGGQTRAAALIGFTLTGGTGTAWYDPPTTGWYREGGGILINDCSPRILFNLIEDNLATTISSGLTSAGGGGIRTGFGAPLIQNNTIRSNQGRYGAGIVVNYDDAEIRNNVILLNSGGSAYGGGGIWVYGMGHTAVIENNTIVQNSVSGMAPSTEPRGKGGGILVWSTGALLRNNILWGNSAAEAPQIKVISGTMTYYNNDIEGKATANGGITADPLFDETALNLLSPGSPCIDAGYDDAAYEDREDPDASGNALYPSMGGLRGDIGAYGGPGAALLPEEASSGVVEPRHQPAFPRNSRLVSNYPNPFNPAATVTWYLARQERVRISVFDALGREVALLREDVLPAGNGSASFDGTGMASGVYFIRLKTSTVTDTRRMTLVR